MKTKTTDLTVRVGSKWHFLPELFLFGLLTLIFASSLSTAVQAAGNLLVTPTRVVFENRTRSAQVTIVNQGTEAGEFRVSFIRQNMTESGDFVEVAESETGLFSDPLIRYSPRQVSLSPGQSQVIRLLLRKPGDLVVGEYRSHMLFQALPPTSSTSIENVGNAEGITIELIPIVGVTIPIIVRHGKLTSRVELTNASITPAVEASGKPRIAVDINRLGTGSIYGDFRVLITPLNGEPVVVAQANSVAVYSNIDKRRFGMPLIIPTGINLVDSVVDVLFIESGSDAATGTLAKTRLVLD